MLDPDTEKKIFELHSGNFFSLFHLDNVTMHTIY